jgi:hypothetical protein
MDAPIQFLPECTGTEEVLLEHLNGRTSEIEIKDPDPIKAEKLRAEELRG